MSPSPHLQFLLATSSRGKTGEISSALSGLEVEFRFLSDLGDLPHPIESGSSFGQNARLKAQHYYRLTGIPALADDSGLSVDALAGAPGVRSARFAGDDRRRIQKLLKLMESFSSPSERTAHFFCCICLCLPTGLIEVSGKVDGRICSEPRGTGGFGYDPVFYYPPLGKTFAEMSLERKNEISHRAQALRKLRKELEGFSANKS